MDFALVCPQCNRSYQRRDFERGETYFECEHCQIELAHAHSPGAIDVGVTPGVVLASLPNWVPGLLRPSELGSKYAGITLLIAFATLIVGVVALQGRGSILSFLPLLCVASVVAAFIVGYHTQAKRNRTAIALMPPMEGPPVHEEVNPHRAPYG